MQTDMAGGLFSMIKAVRDIKSTVATCAGMKADVATLEAWITTVLDQPSIPDFITE